MHFKEDNGNVIIEAIEYFKIENILSAKITDFININMNVQILYDKEIIDDIRHKENLSIGINYRFL